MAQKKSAKLSLVNPSDEAENRRRHLLDLWQNAEQEWRVTSRDMKRRVLALRQEFESYLQQIDATPFDIANEEIPNVIDHGCRKYAVTLVEEFNPIVDNLLGMIDAYAKQHGTHKHLDFQAKLYMLKSQSAESGFQMGVLAGVIFSGAPKEVVDRFERGFMFSVESNHWLVKD